MITLGLLALAALCSASKHTVAAPTAPFRSYANGPCAGSFAGYPFCDTSLPIPDRVTNFVNTISFADKLGQFVNGASAMPSVDMPGYQWWSEALHGVANSPGVTYGGEFPFTTSFPQVCSTSSSFNSTLFNLIGQAISTEARAMNNYGQAGLTFCLDASMNLSTPHYPCRGPQHQHLPRSTLGPGPGDAR